MRKQRKRRVKNQHYRQTLQFEIQSLFTTTTFPQTSNNRQVFLYFIISFTSSHSLSRIHSIHYNMYPVWLRDSSTTTTSSSGSMFFTLILLLRIYFFFFFIYHYSFWTLKSSLTSLQAHNNHHRHRVHYLVQVVDLLNVVHYCCASKSYKWMDEFCVRVTKNANMCVFVWDKLCT